MWLRLIVIVTCLVISPPSFAHGADQHVLGTIMAIDATHVEVKTSKGQSVNVRVNKKTSTKTNAIRKTPTCRRWVIVSSSRPQRKAKCCSPPKSIFPQPNTYRPPHHPRRSTRMIDVALRVTGEFNNHFEVMECARRSFES